MGYWYDEEGVAHYTDDTPEAEVPEETEPEVYAQLQTIIDYYNKNGELKRADQEYINRNYEAMDETARARVQQIWLQMAINAYQKAGDQNLTASGQILNAPRGPADMFSYAARVKSLAGNDTGAVGELLRGALTSTTGKTIDQLSGSTPLTNTEFAQGMSDLALGKPVSDRVKNFIDSLTNQNGGKNPLAAYIGSALSNVGKINGNYNAAEGKASAASAASAARPATPVKTVKTVSPQLADYRKSDQTLAGARKMGVPNVHPTFESYIGISAPGINGAPQIDPAYAAANGWSGGGWGTADNPISRRFAELFPEYTKANAEAIAQEGAWQQARNEYYTKHPNATEAEIDAYADRVAPITVALTDPNYDFNPSTGTTNQVPAWMAAGRDAYNNGTKNYETLQAWKSAAQIERGNRNSQAIYDARHPGWQNMVNDPDQLAPTDPYAGYTYDPDSNMYYIGDPGDDSNWINADGSQYQPDAPADDSYVMADDPYAQPDDPYAPADDWDGGWADDSYASDDDSDGGWADDSDAMATGGLVSRPTLVGEKGPEWAIPTKFGTAIIPADRPATGFLADLKKVNGMADGGIIPSEPAPTIINSYKDWLAKRRSGESATKRFRIPDPEPGINGDFKDSPYMWSDMSRGAPKDGQVYGQVLTPVNLADKKEVERWNLLHPDKSIMFGSDNASGNTTNNYYYGPDGIPNSGDEPRSNFLSKPNPPIVRNTPPQIVYNGEQSREEIAYNASHNLGTTPAISSIKYRPDGKPEPVSGFNTNANQYGALAPTQRQALMSYYSENGGELENDFLSNLKKAAPMWSRSNTARFV